MGRLEQWNYLGNIPSACSGWNHPPTWSWCFQLDTISCRLSCHNLWERSRTIFYSSNVVTKQCDLHTANFSIIRDMSMTSSPSFQRPFRPRLIKCMDGCFQQHKVDNQPLATLEISHLVIATLPFRENPVWSPSGSCLSMGMLEQVFDGGCPPHINQLGLEKRRWNLETSSAVVECPPPYHLYYQCIYSLFITLHYWHFKHHLHLKWPVVHQQLHVIRNTAHRPSTQASYTASRVRPKRKISCAAAQIAATLTISFPRWRHIQPTK